MVNRKIVSLLPWLSALGLLFGSCAGGSSGSVSPSSVEEPPVAVSGPASPSENDKHRGISWVAGNPVTETDFHNLTRNHVTWIVQTPFGWQRKFNSPRVRLATKARVFWGERDIGLETTTHMAKRFGIRILLKPHIWITRAEDGKWRQDIAMETEAEWVEWFASYRSFMLHYARLAERTGIEALCIGTELQATVRERETDWRDLISDIRQVYSGKLLYAANWWREFEEVPFWDALDYIGIQAYFPLTREENPTLEDLRQGWRPHFEAIQSLHERVGKPVVFTEIGYRSSANAAIEPWKWPESLSPTGSEDGLKVQAIGYQAFFQTFWDQDWFAGVYFWKWFPHLQEGERQIPGGFSPQNKPAEEVMARWYGRASR